MERLTRRDFFGRALAAAALANAACGSSFRASPPTQPFKISLAQWSIHRGLQSGKIDHLDFARLARERYDIGAIEFVNTFFKDRSRDRGYLAEMNRRAADHGVVHHLIMCDAEGLLGDPDEKQRLAAVDNHRRWVDAARELGCATIRVNADSRGTPDEQRRLAADGLHRLSEYGEEMNINIIVENHEHLSMNAAWLTSVIQLVAHRRCGTLPDFGNFDDHNPYSGVALMMPLAKAVSAKAFDFDANGEESTMDYHRLMKQVTDAGFHSWVGIEYEGDRLSEDDGIAATLRLLISVRRELSA